MTQSQPVKQNAKAPGRAVGLSGIERVIVDFYESNDVLVHEAGAEWFVAGDGQFSLTALAMAILSALPAAAPAEPGETNSVADSTGEKTGTHGASKEIGGQSRADLTPVSTLSPPPPDAVRSALWHAQVRFQCLADHFKEVGEDALLAMSEVDAERMAKGLAALAPAVGVTGTREIKSVIDEMIAVATIEDDGNIPEWTSDNQAEIDKWQVRLSDALSASDSGAGAGEPWPGYPGYALAAPPVRGDRERLLADLVEHLLQNDPNEPIADNGMTVFDAWREQANRVLIDTPFSLPLQPSASEPIWPRSFESAPRDGSWIIARCNDHSEMYKLRWDGEHWSCPEANTSFGDGLFLPNGDWVPDLFSRQATPISALSPVPDATVSARLQPFTTAPRDGRWIVVRCNDHSKTYLVQWNGGHWIDNDGLTYGDGLFLPNGDWEMVPEILTSPQDAGRAAAIEDVIAVLEALQAHAKRSMDNKAEQTNGHAARFHRHATLGEAISAVKSLSTKGGER